MRFNSERGKPTPDSAKNRQRRAAEAVFPRSGRGDQELNTASIGEAELERQALVARPEEQLETRSNLFERLRKMPGVEYLVGFLVIAGQLSLTCPRKVEGKSTDRASTEALAEPTPEEINAILQEHQPDLKVEVGGPDGQTVIVSVPDDNGNFPEPNEPMIETTLPGATVEYDFSVYSEYAGRGYERGAKMRAGQPDALTEIVYSRLDPVFADYEFLQLDPKLGIDYARVHSSGEASDDGTKAGDLQISADRGEQILMATQQALIDRGIAAEKISGEFVGVGGQGGMAEFGQALFDLGILKETSTEARTAATRKIIQNIHDGLEIRADVLQKFDETVQIHRGAHVVMEIKFGDIVVHMPPTKSAAAWSQWIKDYARVEEADPASRVIEPLAEPFVPVPTPPGSNMEPQVSPTAGMPTRPMQTRPMSVLPFPQEPLPGGTSFGGVTTTGTPFSQEPLSPAQGLPSVPTGEPIPMRRSPGQPLTPEPQQPSKPPTATPSYRPYYHTPWQPKGGSRPFFKPPQQPTPPQPIPPRIKPIPPEPPIIPRTIKEKPPEPPPLPPSLQSQPKRLVKITYGPGVQSARQDRNVKGMQVAIGTSSSGARSGSGGRVRTAGGREARYGHTGQRQYRPNKNES